MAICYLAFPNVETRTVTVQLAAKPTESQVRRALNSVEWLHSSTDLIGGQSGYPYRCSTWTNTGSVDSSEANASQVTTALQMCVRISMSEYVAGQYGALSG